jgi:GT2 family glycosyltransferase
MIWYFNPFSTDKKFLDAVDKHINLVTDPKDWIVLRDGDTAFIRPDWGNVIKSYIEKYPDTGLFTCYASRCHYQCQISEFAQMENPNILFHAKIADKHAELFKGQVDEVSRRIAGHLMVIQRKTWSRIRAEVYREAADKTIRGVDTKISYAVLNAGLKIRLMKELYIFHYLRMAEGIGYREHLK